MIYIIYVLYLNQLLHIFLCECTFHIEVIVQYFNHERSCVSVFALTAAF